MLLLYRDYVVRSHVVFCLVTCIVYCRMSFVLSILCLACHVNYYVLSYTTGVCAGLAGSPIGPGGKCHREKVSNIFTTHFKNLKSQIPNFKNESIF